MLKHERHDKINDHRATEGEKREVDKIQPDGSCLYSQPGAQPCADTERAMLKPSCDAADHAANLAIAIGGTQQVPAIVFLHLVVSGD
jgi:hypothetical protein